MRHTIGRAQPDPVRRWLIKLAIAAALPLMCWPFAAGGLAFYVGDCDATYGCTVSQLDRWVLRLVVLYPVVLVGLFLAAWWCNAHGRRRLAIGLTTLCTVVVAIPAMYFVVGVSAWF